MSVAPVRSVSREDGGNAALREPHELEHSRFLSEVRSFDFWLQSVEGYLIGTEHGHRPGVVDLLPDATARDRLATVLCIYCVGEAAALEGASGMVRIAPNQPAKIFLATQAVDEARHLEVFVERLRDLGVEDPERAIDERAPRALRQFRDRLLGFVEARDWEGALLAQNVVFESLEFAVFQEHASVADPVTAEVLDGVIKDERRHIGFGENELGGQILAAPHIRLRLERLRAELDPFVLSMLEEVARAITLEAATLERIVGAYRASVERLRLGRA